jgi:putative addiction module killer protein
MEAIQKEIREYITEDGKNPFRKWLLALNDHEVRYKLRERLDRLRLGNLGDHKSVGGGVFELRIHGGPGYRIYLVNGNQRL